ncbi:MAG: ROK family protein [Cyclobacteriaceae bacterium]|nr:ROK family protein [Cyclobacteriaceae bacterium]
MKNNLAIGIDLGGTHIKYALASVEGTIYWEAKKTTDAEQGREAMIERLAECVKEAIDVAPSFGEVLCTGIGTSGLVDIERGYVLGGAPNLPDWEDLPLASILSEKTGLPTFVDNDANLMGLGEYRYGFGGEGNHMIFLTIGTGIGGGMIINGELYRGHHFAGAELGCIPMNCEEKTGYWEDFASTSAMVTHYKSLQKEPVKEEIDGKYITKAFFQGEQAAIDTMEKHTHLVAMGVAGIVNIFNPEHIVIGGGISEAGEFYIEKIKQKVEGLAMEDCFRGVQLSAAKLGNKAGFLGATYFAFSQLK